MTATSASRAAGGIFEVERRLSLELLLARGHQVQVFSGMDVYTDADLPSWLPIVPQVFSRLGPRAFGYLPGMSAGLNDWRPDITHLHMLWMFPSIVTNRWSRRSGKPYMITLHGMLDVWALRHSWWKKKLALGLYEQRNMDEAACIHVLSKAEANSAREFGLKRPLAIIPNGVDVPDASVIDSKYREAKQRLLFLGRIHPKKGLINLLLAWNEVRHSVLGGNWVLIIAGWDELGHEAELKKLAAELGIIYITASSYEDDFGDASLVFLGPQFGDSKKLCLQGCDAFVLPSYSEGLPMSVLEAWAYGKPVMMTPMCNLQEGVELGAAIEVQPEAGSLQMGLLSFMSMTKEDQCAMGLRGRLLVKDRFTWTQVGVQMEEVYLWLVHGGVPPKCVLVGSEH